MMATKLRDHHPEVKWAEREDKVYLTVLLPDAKDADVKLLILRESLISLLKLDFYELKLELNDKVNVEESKINIGFKKHILHFGESRTHMVEEAIAWRETASLCPGDMDMSGMGGMGGMDFSNFGGMGGMGGMGGLEGLFLD
ncbi:unnamed protein product [Cochlearia groenlandica]